MLRVAVVDDERDARDKMIKCINQAQNGISIVGAASDGFEALKLICSENPDIVLTDIEMPGMSGLDVIRAVRERELPTIFIVISSYDKFAYAQEALRLSVDDYLLKPFFPSDVCSAIYRAADHIRSVKLLPAIQNAQPQKSLNVIDFISAPFGSMRMPLVYPYNEEHALIETLQFGDGFDVKAALDIFFSAVKQQNAGEEAITNCYIILYVEIYHATMNRNIDFSTLDIPAFQGDSNLDLLESTIDYLCAETSRQFDSKKSACAVVSRATKYIDEHYNEPLTLEQIASAVYVCPTYLSSLFMRTLSVHFTEYLHSVRIENAVRLLSEQPHLKSYEVGELIGYTSFKYFSQIFKKVKGVTISEFRKHSG